jgi:RNA polymerase Rpb1, domain 7
MILLQDTYIEEDKELVQSYFELGEDEKTRRMSPWLLRIELNRCAPVGNSEPMADLIPSPSCLLCMLAKVAAHLSLQP